ncbi:unnamed protein product, partial [Prorocentrum cordatum]
AVCGHGKDYAKRVGRFESGLAVRREAGAAESKLIEDDDTLQPMNPVKRRKTTDEEEGAKGVWRSEEEREQQRKLQQIYEKYSQSGAQASVGRKAHRGVVAAATAALAEEVLEGGQLPELVAKAACPAAGVPEPDLSSDACEVETPLASSQAALRQDGPLDALLRLAVEAELDPILRFPALAAEDAEVEQEGAEEAEPAPVGAHLVLGAPHSGPDSRAHADEGVQQVIADRVLHLEAAVPESAAAILVPDVLGSDLGSEAALEGEDASLDEQVLESVETTESTSAGASLGPDVAGEVVEVVQELADVREASASGALDGLLRGQVRFCVNFGEGGGKPTFMPPYQTAPASGKGVRFHTLLAGTMACLAWSVLAAVAPEHLGNSWYPIGPGALRSRQGVAEYDIMYFSPIQVGDERNTHYLYFNTEIYNRQWPQTMVDQMLSQIDELRHVELGIYPCTADFKQRHRERVMFHCKMALAYLDSREARIAMKLCEVVEPSTRSSEVWIAQDPELDLGLLRVTHLSVLASAARRVKFYQKAPALCLQGRGNEMVFYKNFMDGYPVVGAIEVTSRAAVLALATDGAGCENMANGAAEDDWFARCLGSLGAVMREDGALLQHDNQPPGDRCFDGWWVAMHPYKDLASYTQCDEQAAQ